jgi:hypothetical protein
VAHLLESVGGGGSLFIEDFLHRHSSISFSSSSSSRRPCCDSWKDVSILV